MRRRASIRFRVSHAPGSIADFIKQCWGVISNE
jgi:hypothetical protein